MKSGDVQLFGSVIATSSVMYSLRPHGLRDECPFAVTSPGNALSPIWTSAVVARRVQSVAFA